MAILQSTEISGSLSISGSLTAQSFVGDGSSITGVVAVAPAGTVSGSAQVVSLLGSHSGNVGFGTTSPSSFANYKNLSIKGGSSGANLDFHNSSGTRVAAIVSNPSTNFIVETNEATPFILKTNDTERMRITSAGYTEIKAVSGASRLYLEGTSGTHFLTGTSGGAFGIYNDTNSSYRVFITSGGNVGIGTTSPIVALQVHDSLGTTLDDGVLRLIDDTSYAQNVGAAIALGFKFNSGGSVLQRGGVIKAIKENTTDGNYASALLFGTTANNASTAERMRIDSSGKVGIGTTSPATELDVDGTNYE